MTAKAVIILLIVIALIALPLFLSSCRAEKYKVVCNESFFTNLKSSYRAGEKVRLYYPFIATDTDYRFYLDGESISCEYSDYKGYIITFTMPDRDVTLTCESKNSMEYQPVSADLPAGTELFTYTETTRTPEGNTAFCLKVTVVSDTEHDMTVTETDGSISVYTIPRFPYESVYSYNDIYDLSDWNTLEEYDSLDGKSIELSFYNDGEYITISSDRMPEDGEGILRYLVSHFTDYMTEAYKAEQQKG